MRLSGLTDLVHGSKGTIEPIAPGDVESYDLATNGKVTFRESIRFHKLGEPPAYKTVASPLGKTMFFLPNYNSRIEILLCNSLTVKEQCRFR